MATFNVDYIIPTRTQKEVTDGARTLFQNEEAALFRELGLGDGGFRANADRVFMLDDTNTLVTPPAYDAGNDNGMTAAAQNGRLYIMDKNYRLRQVRLEGNEDEGFTLELSKPLRARQIPRNSVAYFIRRFKGIIDDFVRDMTEAFEKMKIGMSKAYEQMKKDMPLIFGGPNKDSEANAEQLVSTDAPLENPQPGSTLKEEQLQQPSQSELSTEALLAKNPTEQTTPEFERYLKALADRGDGSLVAAALNKNKGEPTDYYEALSQELEGQIARYIRNVAPNEANPAQREAFLDKQKPIVAFMSNDLRKFVQGKVTVQSVEDFYAQGLKADSPMGKKLQDEANQLQNTGVKEYMDGVLAEIESSQQEIQLSQTNVNQMQQNQVTHSEPQPPSIGGMGGFH